VSIKHSFKAKIYKVGINPCVKVPYAITESMKPVKGYIPVKGTIDNHPFRQTLVPVKDAQYRLYVNGTMLKGSNSKVGQTVAFTIQQDKTPKEKLYSMPEDLKKALKEANLTDAFEQLTSARKKDIIKYLTSLKTEETLNKNINKVIAQLKAKAKQVRVP
jgi:hypothetical protein